MTREQIRDEIKEIIHFITPDEDLSQLKEEDTLRDQLDLDSMDFLDIIMELRKRHKVEVPEADYPHVQLWVASAADSHLTPCR